MISNSTQIENMVLKENDEKYMIKTEYKIKAPVELTIALVTDLHEHNPDQVLKLLMASKPDVIAVAGDILERHEKGENLDKGDRSVISRLICLGIRFADGLLESAKRREKRDIKSENSYRFLREAAKLAPVVMSLGNHEMYLKEEDRTVLREAGVSLLDNASAEFCGVMFGGLTSRQVTGEIDVEFLKAFQTSENYKILLCHHPEYYDFLEKYDIDLILSGHCHGGQIRINNHGIFAPGQGLFPKYHHGVYRRLVVSAGTANTASIPRWGNPCEVVIVRLGEFVF